MTDIIHETLLKVKEAVSSGRQINDETLLKIEEDIKREHNGYRYTVSKRPSHRALRELCTKDLDAGHTYKEVAKRHGISERTVYRRAKEPGDE